MSTFAWFFNFSKNILHRFIDDATFISLFMKKDKINIIYKKSKNSLKTQKTKHLAILEKKQGKKLRIKIVLDSNAQLLECNSWFLYADQKISETGSETGVFL